MRGIKDSKISWLGIVELSNSFGAICSSSSGGDGSALRSKLQEFASLASQEENRLQQLGGKVISCIAFLILRDGSASKEEAVLCQQKSLKQQKSAAIQEESFQPVLPKELISEFKPSKQAFTYGRV